MLYLLTNAYIQVWDIRTKHEIHVLSGHHDAVATIAVNSVDPQVITGSHDSTVKVSYCYMI
jgi:pleiotropic regulator 1